MADQKSSGKSAAPKKVLAKDALKKTKGGLNPQPLPPAATKAYLKQ